jgi:repressor LexA
MLGSELSPKDAQALRFIRNSLNQRAKSPSIREIQRELGYGSPRSAALIVERLIKCKLVERRSNGRLRVLEDLALGDNDLGRTVPIPLVGTVPCGSPLMAEENVEATIPVSTTLARPPHRYFLLRAKGNSMNRSRIHDRDLVLVRQQASAENGDIVVAIIDDEATIKQFKRTKTAVILRPNSTFAEYQPIILSSGFQVQGVVVTTIPQLE